MFRALLELLLTIAVIAVARVVLVGFMKSISGSSSTAFQDGNSQAGQRRPERTASEPHADLLHKDPVCGTFVTESTHFRRQVGREIFFYCSEACQQKHAVSTR